ncbi:MAG: Sjogren's syndrome/scleroderma autoantigen 1 family protein [Promethearchaeia archaeon]
MININEDTDTKIMANLLKSGYTMLNLACPVCNTPLFRNKEKEIFCPICKKKVVIIKENSNTNLIKSEEGSNNFQELSEESMDTKELKKRVKKVIHSKIEFLCNKLENEDQLEKISSIINIINLLFDFYKKI